MTPALSLTSWVALANSVSLGFPVCKVEKGCCGSNEFSCVMSSLLPGNQEGSVTLSLTPFVLQVLVRAGSLMSHESVLTRQKPGIAEEPPSPASIQETDAPRANHGPSSLVVGQAQSAPKPPEPPPRRFLSSSPRERSSRPIPSRATQGWVGCLRTRQTDTRPTGSCSGRAPEGQPVWAPWAPAERDACVHPTYLAS